MSWDDWAQIEQAQAAADVADEKRRQERAERRLHVVPDPVEPGHDPLRATQSHEDATGWQSDMWGREKPLYAPDDPRNPGRPRVDPVIGLRLYARLLQDMLEEDSDG